MDNQTYNIIQVIGSPFIDSNNELDRLKIDELYEFSKKNRMPLLYLKSISELDVQDKYKKEYIYLIDRWSEIEGSIKKVLEILDREKIMYTTFKSIKPYREITVDIDLLILDCYERAVKVLKKSGYVLLERGPLSSTFRDQEVKIDYDIYDEVGVSQIIYYDKDKVREQIIDKPLLTGGYIKSLSPVTDLLAIIAHSVIKEQMYIIAEYYSTLFYLERIGVKGIESFLKMSEQLGLNTAVKAHLGITYVIHKLVHDVEPLPLRGIISKLGYNGLEIQRVKESQLKMPHKFHPITLINALSEKLRDPKSRRSFSEQLINMMSPSFTMDFIPKMLSHVKRETY